MFNNRASRIGETKFKNILLVGRCRFCGVVGDTGLLAMGNVRGENHYKTAIFITFYHSDSFVHYTFDLNPKVPKVYVLMDGWLRIR